ncbi:MAG: sugar transferase [Bacilli bacterium]|nr:sugar transferase [Bacilli bacterium]
MNDGLSSFDKVISQSEIKHTLFDEIKETIYLSIKRLFDIIISLIGLLFMIPIMLVIKIAYVLTGDFKSIIFSQNRIGLNGKEFKLYKFRSMILNADEELYKLLEENKDLKEEYQTNKKLKNDPRITKIGKFIRKTSLDELPQVINIFKGDMSLIGNRPYLPREKDDIGLYYNQIIKTKPGLTGYWQVSGRNNVSFADRVRLETWYSNHTSLNLDTKIFFKTFKTVITEKITR